MLRNHWTFLLFTGFFFLQASAQEKSPAEREQEVRAAIDRMFEGMREGDSAKVHSVVRDDARFATSYTNRKQEHLLQQDDFREFLAAVGSPHPKAWDERIISCEIRVEGNLAQVWAQYEFYAGSTFSHCGVDAFQLVNDGSGWKILNLTDTRKTEGCH